ncbi:MAG TPA: serine hydrolase domain-containing protein, partial [Pyrinomonadaceae bacterium]|nr:serine hydrolase domain-containing protein [Pyrinomonadaceae bacterium]
ENITIRDLLNHRSGFSDEWAVLLLTQASMANRFDESQFLRLLAAQPEPEIAPGKGYLYSNSDFGLLRLVMERASGKTLPDWMQTRMFEPLKMRSTAMQRNPLDIIPDKADSYVPAGANKFAHGRVQKTSPGGNYFILTNAEDLQIWAAAQADSSSEIAQAFARLWNETRKIPGKENHSPVGYSQKQIGGKIAIAHEGVNGWNYLTRLPAERLTVITLGNLEYDGYAEQNREIVNYLLGVQPPAKLQLLTKPITVSASELKKYAGRYLWQNHVSWQSLAEVKFSDFFVEGDKLRVLFSPGYTITLVPVGDGVFYYGEEAIGAQFTFTRAAKDAPFKVEVKYDDGVLGETMVQDLTPMWQPTREQLTPFTGKFYSPHLDFYWTIEQNADGKLFIKRPTIADTPLLPGDAENRFRFTSESYPGVNYRVTVQFHRNEKGDITHFIVQSGRVMKHRFEKIKSK